MRLRMYYESTVCCMYVVMLSHLVHHMVLTVHKKLWSGTKKQPLFPDFPAVLFCWKKYLTEKMH